MEGEGVLKNVYGTFTGIFKSDEKEGEGKMLYVNGDVYQGGWKADQREGKGCLTAAEGENHIHWRLGSG